MLKSKQVEYYPFSHKQLFLMNWWLHPEYKHKEGIICDGAIRAGKTIPMSLSFVMWAMTEFDDKNFGLCGKTIKSLKRNVVKPLMAMLKCRGYEVEEVKGESMLLISTDENENRFYLFGGKDEASQDLIQGITLAGVLLDEVALMPESFINQAVARVSEKGGKKWFNCNPGHPKHYFNVEYIKKRTEKNLIRVHFNMEDNPSLDDDKLKHYRNSFSGVFFKRFILGLWCASDGLVYEQFASNKKDYIIDCLDKSQQLAYVTIGVDFGGTKSGHAFTAVGFTSGFQEMIVLDEYYKKKRIDPDKLQSDFIDFVEGVKSKYNVYEAYCDSAEQTLMAGLEGAVLKSGVCIEVKNAIKGQINNRIAFFNTMIAQKRFKVMAHCVRVIEAMEEAVYDETKYEDKRLDNGSSNIDTIDAMEYAVEPVMDDVIYL